MNLELAEFVVMPNHIHGIVIIGENKFNSKRKAGSHNVEDAMHCVSTAGRLYLRYFATSIFTFLPFNRCSLIICNV